MKRIALGTLVVIGGAALLWQAGWLDQPSANGLAQQTLGNGVSAETISPSSAAQSVYRGAGAPTAREDTTLSAPEQPAVQLDAHRTIPAAEMPVLLANSSTYARSVIEDGVVTVDEYRAAAQSSYTCTIAATANMPGVTIDEPTDDQLSYGFRATTREWGDKAHTAYESCNFEYFRDVATAWDMEPAYQRLTPLWQKIGVCMTDHGADVPENPVWLDLVAASRGADDPGLVSACEAEIQR